MAGRSGRHIGPLGLLRRRLKAKSTSVLASLEEQGLPVDKSTLSKWERGVNRLPSRMVRPLAKAYGTSVDVVATCVGMPGVSVTGALTPPTTDQTDARQDSRPDELARDVLGDPLSRPVIPPGETDQAPGKASSKAMPSGFPQSVAHYHGYVLLAELSEEEAKAIIRPLQILIARLRAGEDVDLPQQKKRK